MNTTPVPWSRPTRRISDTTDICVETSSAVVGSSAITSAGSEAKAIAISTRWFCPPEIWNGYRAAICAGSGSSTSSRARSMMPCRSRRGIPSRARCSANCAATVRSGFSAVSGSCGMTVMRSPRSRRRSRGAMRVRSVSPNRAVPRVTAKPSGRVPASTRPIIDLPAPLSPTSPMTRPGATAKVRSRSTSIPRRATVRPSIERPAVTRPPWPEGGCPAPGAGRRPEG